MLWILSLFLDNQSIGPHILFHNFFTCTNEKCKHTHISKQKKHIDVHNNNHNLSVTLHWVELNILEVGIDMIMIAWYLDASFILITSLIYAVKRTKLNDFYHRRLPKMIVSRIATMRFFFVKVRQQIHRHHIFLSIHNVLLMILKQIITQKILIALWS